MTKPPSALTAKRIEMLRAWAEEEERVSPSLIDGERGETALALIDALSFADELLREARAVIENKGAYVVDDLALRITAYLERNR